MEFHRNNNNSSSPCSSNSSSSSSVTTTNNNNSSNNNKNHPNNNDRPKTTPSNDPMHSWSESVSKARSRIQSLAAILPDHQHSLISLADSEHPALSLLSSPLLTPPSPLPSLVLTPIHSITGSTTLSSLPIPHLRLFVFSFIPLLSGLYLTRVHSSDPPSLAGFEAILLALYAAETKSRTGKLILLTIPDLSLSLNLPLPPP